MTTLPDTLYVTRESQLLQLGASKEAGKYNMQGVHFDSHCAVATNGHYLVVRKKDQDEPTGVTLRFDKARRGKLQLINTFQRIGQSFQYASPQGVLGDAIDCNFPPYPQVVKQALQPSKKHTVHIDVKYLYEIVEALGGFKGNYSASLELNIEDPKSAIVVTVNGSRDAAAVLMPLNGKHYPNSPSQVLMEVTGVSSDK